jgi:hypothetical protein
MLKSTLKNICICIHGWPKIVPAWKRRRLLVYLRSDLLKWLIMSALSEHLDYWFRSGALQYWQRVLII